MGRYSSSGSRYAKGRSNDEYLPLRRLKLLRGLQSECIDRGVLYRSNDPSRSGRRPIQDPPGAHQDMKSAALDGLFDDVVQGVPARGDTPVGKDDGFQLIGGDLFAVRGP